MNPYLYVIVRNDLASMTPGRCAAQACHAANQFVFEIQGQPDDIRNDLFVEWAKSTPQGFGTTIVLSAPIEVIRSIVDVTNKLGFASGITVDPTYPIQDGDCVHLINIETCGYVFGDKEKLTPILQHLPLM